MWGWFLCFFLQIRRDYQIVEFKRAESERWCYIMIQSSQSLMRNLIKDEQSPSQDEKSPCQDEKSPCQDEKSPSQDEKSPSQDEKSPCQDEKSPSKDEKSPCQDEKSPSQDEKSPSQDEKSYLPVSSKSLPALISSIWSHLLQNLKMTYQMQSIMQQVTSVDSCSSSLVRPLSS